MNAHGTSEDLIVKLFRRFLFLRGGEALSLLSASCAFFGVVSAFAVSHKL